MNAADNGNASADPAMISDRHRLSVFISAASCYRMDGMTCSINRNVGPKHAVIADCDFSNIDHYAMIVCIKIFSKLNMGSIFAIKRRYNKKIF